MATTKKCCKCGSTKARSGFGRSAKRADGLQVWCKVCFRTYVAANRAKLNKQKTDYYESRKDELKDARDRLRELRETDGRPQLPAEKQCTKCSLLKPVGDFGSDVYTADGLRYWCKECNALNGAAYLEINKTEVRAKEMERRRANPEHFRKLGRQQYAVKLVKYRAGTLEPRIVRETKRCIDCNQIKAIDEFSRSALRADGLQPRCRACNRLYRITHKDIFRKAYRKWRKANLDKCAAIVAKRKADKLRARPPWADLKKIAGFYSEAKRLTKETGIEHAVDHIVPLRNPMVCGLHCEANLQVITAMKNSLKNNKFESDWEYFPVARAA